MSTNAILGTVGATVFAASFLAGSVVFHQPFLIVEILEVKGDQVFVERTYTREEETVADWHVTIVSDKETAPTCNTIHGSGLHEGWSVYPGNIQEAKTFTVDVWVNDPGCYERLSTGPHKMFTTWTPRNGDDPVTNITEFSVVK